MLKKYLIHPSPYGALRLLASELGLAGIYFSEHKHLQLDSAWQADSNDALLKDAAQQLDAYFAGQLREFDLPLDCTQGTPFQQEVWRALQTIPYGEVRSYSAVAQQIGRPNAIRAVGAANGRNPLSIVIPCHRVIAANGDLQGYAGGLENKRRLLLLESRQ
ncbi:methylated-DNA--[protein]-cysteine S-methyltransferase [Undibacterium baiyunense]|uniref:Methylated-DNA--protein-cysteine methyltransferase n=1 Tax=Undibacterium baiyunense TaxID=2828731 RepID=A0A941I3B2_9BURK|nr:methylated-DNA--[protein]-cysteine S-methyltransferase [Undibacterium baiyunense]MBR7745849.1 methylated-DNA--[protein]-cysteine S-methyltransferase [Undibacterium baiyunense]